MGKTKTQHGKFSKNVETQKYLVEEWMPVVDYSHEATREGMKATMKITRPDGAEGIS